MELTDLTRQDCLRLMRFVCSFAWADLEIADSERTLVGKLLDELELDDDERSQVKQWLEVPPRAEELDPNDIPLEHRQIFLNVMFDMVRVDGKIDPDEMENLSLFEQLLR